MAEIMRNPSIWRGFVAGASGGLVGAWCMNQFQALSNRLLHPHRTEGAGDSSAAPGQSSQNQNAPATAKAAAALVRRFLGRDLTPGEKKIADPLMHYGFGTVTGAAYGIATEVAPATAAGAGQPFGAFIWLMADETAVPALGLSNPPWQYPVSTHAYALASHLVYGLTLELSRRAVRKLLGRA